MRAACDGPPTMAAKYEAEIDRINRLSAAALADMVLQDAQLLRYRAAGTQYPPPLFPPPATVLLSTTVRLA